MAKPQIEEGYVRIANDLLDAIMRLPLSQYEYRTLLCLIRLTYGWNRKEVQTGYHSLSKAIGIQSGHVARAIKNLAVKNIITARKDSKGTIYKIQKDYDKWLATTPVAECSCAGVITTPVESTPPTPVQEWSTPLQPLPDLNQLEPKDRLKDSKDNISLRERLFGKIKKHFPSLSSIPESIPTEHVDFLVYKIGKGDIRPDTIHHPIAYLKKLSIGEAFPSFLEREAKDNQRKEKTRVDKVKEKEEERQALESREFHKEKAREVINSLKGRVCQSPT